MYGDNEKDSGPVRNFKYLMDCFNKNAKKLKHSPLNCQSIM